MYLNFNYRPLFSFSYFYVLIWNDTENFWWFQIFIKLLCGSLIGRSRFWLFVPNQGLKVQIRGISLAMFCTLMTQYELKSVMGARTSMFPFKYYQWACMENESPVMWSIFQITMSLFRSPIFSVLAHVLCHSELSAYKILCFVVMCSLLNLSTSKTSKEIYSGVYWKIVWHR